MLLRPQDKQEMQTRTLMALGAGLLQAGAPRVGAPGPGFGGALQSAMQETQRAESGILNRRMAQVQMDSAKQTKDLNAAKLASAQASAERLAAADKMFLGDGEASQGYLTDPRQRAMYQADPAAFIKAEVARAGQKPIFQKKGLLGGKVQEVVSYDNGRSFQPFGEVYDRRDPYIQASTPGPNGGVLTNVIPRSDLDKMLGAASPGPNGVRSVSVGGKPNTSRDTEFRKATNTIDSMESSLNNYRRLVSASGSRIMPSSEKLELQAAHRDLMLEAKELYNLGVLNGPDLALMESVIIDPTSVKGVFYEAIGGKDVFENQLNTITSKIAAGRERAQRIYGNRKNIGTQPAASKKRFRYENGNLIPR